MGQITEGQLHKRLSQLIGARARWITEQRLDGPDRNGVLGPPELGARDRMEDEGRLGQIRELRYLLAWCRNDTEANGPTSGEDIRRLRLDAGITQVRMAQGIGMSRTQLSQLETGKLPLTRKMANRIHTYLEGQRQ